MRRQALADAGLKVFPNLAEPGVLASLEEQEKHPRYKHHALADTNEACAARMASYSKYWTTT
jgi:hypothetical protein